MTLLLKTLRNLLASLTFPWISNKGPILISSLIQTTCFSQLSLCHALSQISMYSLFLLIFQMILSASIERDIFFKPDPKLCLGQPNLTHVTKLPPD